MMATKTHPESVQDSQIHPLAGCTGCYFDSNDFLLLGICASSASDDVPTMFCVCVFADPTGNKSALLSNVVPADEF